MPFITEQLIRQLACSHLRLVRYGIVRNNPSILSESFLDRMETKRKLAWTAHDYHMIQKISETIQLIEVCLRIGMDEAFFACSYLNRELPGAAAAQRLENSIEKALSFRSPRELKQKIVELDELLKTVEPEKDAILWCELNNKAGRFLLQNPLGTRIDNIEKALDRFQRTMEISASCSPFIKANTHYYTAIAYSERIAGNNAENRETAIAHCRSAQNICRRNIFPFYWASIQNLLATSYLRRTKGQRCENIEKAVMHFEAGLAVCTKRAFPVEWANIKHNLAIALKKRIKGDRTENIERAISNCRETLTVRKLKYFPLPRADTLQNIAVAYAKRKYGNQSQNMEKAIHCCHEALQIRTKDSFPFHWAMLQTNLANYYKNRSKGNKNRNLEKAIEHFESALSVFTRTAFPYYWAAARLGIGDAFLKLRQEQQLENSEGAFRNYKSALEVFSLENYPVQYSKTMLGLARSCIDGKEGDRNAMARESRRYYKEALSIQRLYGHPSAMLTTLSEMADSCMREGKYVEALDYFSEISCLDELIRKEEACIQTESTRIEETALQFSKASYCCSAIGDFKGALESLEKGKTRLLKEKCLGDKQEFERLKGQDKRHYERLIGRLREIWIEQSEEAAAGKTLFETAEESRALKKELEELIRGIRGYEPGFLCSDIPYERFLNCLSCEGRTAAAAFNVTKYGSAISLLAGTPGRPVEKTFIIDEFTDEQLNRILRRWFQAYALFRSDRNNLDLRLLWNRKMIELTAELYSQLFQPIHDFIRSRKIDELIFMPHKGLHIIPLHLMNRMENGRRRFLIDHYHIRYAPSFTLLYPENDEKIFRNVSRSLTAVSDPTRALYWSRREIDYIAALFDEKTVLRGREATIANVAEKLKKSTYVHMACHAEFNADDAYESSILLAYDESCNSTSPSGKTLKSEPAKNSCEKISVRRVTNHDRSVIIGMKDDCNKTDMWTLRKILRELRMPDTCLVVLSACESGIVSVDGLPDETIGLSAGFIAAGARKVVSSLWKIDDECSCEVMKIFYSCLMVDDLPPAKALRKALLQIRSNPKYEEPVYWGAFKISG